LIIVLTSVKVTTGAFKINKKLRCLRFWCFINIYIINRTLHGCLGIRILPSCADDLSPISIQQHSTIKFVSPCGHVVSCTSFAQIIFTAGPNTSDILAQHGWNWKYSKVLYHAKHISTGKLLFHCTSFIQAVSNIFSPSCKWPINSTIKA